MPAEHPAACAHPDTVKRDDGWFYCLSCGRRFPSPSHARAAAAEDRSAATTEREEAVVPQTPYGDGLVIVVKDDLECELWIDGEWLGDVRLARLDQFIQLRKYLDEVDDVAVLTQTEANDLREALSAA